MASKELTPVAYTEIKVMALDVVKSGLFPGIKTTEAAATLMMLCQADGIHPMEAMRRYHIIEGRPSKRADAMQAEFQADGGRIKWVKSTVEECEAIFTHPLYCPEGLTVRVTLAELRDSGVAMAQGGLKSNYKKFPRQTLKARVISEGVRAVDPGIIVGIYTPEEHEDPMKPEYTVVDAGEQAQPTASAIVSRKPMRDKEDLVAALTACATPEDFGRVRGWIKEDFTNENHAVANGNGETYLDVFKTAWVEFKKPKATTVAEAPVTPTPPTINCAEFIDRIKACTSPDEFKKLDTEFDGTEALHSNEAVIMEMDSKRTDFDDGMPI